MDFRLVISADEEVDYTEAQRGAKFELTKKEKSMILLP